MGCKRVPTVLQVGVGQLAVHAVEAIHEGAEFAGVDEERLLAAVAEAAFGVGVFVFREEPEADGDLRAVEELAGEGDHAVHEVGLDEGAADVAFARLVGGHAAIGEDEAGHAVRGEMVDEVLHPGEVGVAFGRDAELPAHVVVLAEPVGIVEGRVGEDVIGVRRRFTMPGQAEVGMEIAAEGVGMLGAEVRLNAPDGEVHHREPAGGGVAFLPWVFRRVHVVAQLVRREPELGLKADVGGRGRILGRGGAFGGHGESGRDQIRRPNRGATVEQPFAGGLSNSAARRKGNPAEAAPKTQDDKTQDARRRI